MASSSPPGHAARKHAAVLQLLHDADWCQRSNRAIARQCGVDHKTVGKWRKALSGEYPQMKRTVQRNGTTYTLHLPPAPPQDETDPPWTPLALSEVLVGGGLAPTAAGRLLARLKALPPGKWQQAARLLCELFL